MNKLKAKAILSITENAASRIKYLTKQKVKDNNTDVFVKIGVKRRGCNGLTYTMNYVDNIGKFDEVIDQNDVKVVVDNKAVMYLLGTEMDYLEDDLKSEFTFTNPNSKGSCGCGESFNV